VREQRVALWEGKDVLPEAIHQLQCVERMHPRPVPVELPGPLRQRDAPCDERRLGSPVHLDESPVLLGLLEVARKYHSELLSDRNVKASKGVQTSAGVLKAVLENDLALCAEIHVVRLQHVDVVLPLREKAQKRYR